MMNSEFNEISLSGLIKSLQDVISINKDDNSTNKSIENIFSVLTNSQNGQISTEDFLQKIIDEGVSQDSELFSELQSTIEEIANLTLEDGKEGILSFQDFTELALNDEIENFKGVNGVDLFDTIPNFESVQEPLNSLETTDNLDSLTLNGNSYIKFIEGEAKELKSESNKTALQTNKDLFENPVVPDIEHSSLILSRFVKDFAVKSDDNPNGFEAFEGMPENNNEAYFKKVFGEGDEKTTVYLKVVKDGSKINIIQTEVKNGLKSILYAHLDEEKQEDNKGQTIEDALANLGVSNEEIEDKNNKFSSYFGSMNNENNYLKYKQFINSQEAPDNLKNIALTALDVRFIDEFSKSSEINDYNNIPAEFKEIISSSLETSSKSAFNEFIDKFNSFSFLNVAKIMEKYKHDGKTGDFLNTMMSNLDLEKQQEFLEELIYKLDTTGLNEENTYYTEVNNSKIALNQEISAYFSNIPKDDIEKLTKNLDMRLLSSNTIEDIFSAQTNEIHDKLVSNNYSMENNFDEILNLNDMQFSLLASKFDDNSSLLSSLLDNNDYLTKDEILNLYFNRIENNDNAFSSAASILGNDLAKYIKNASDNEFMEILNRLSKISSDVFNEMINSYDKLDNNKVNNEILEFEKRLTNISSMPGMKYEENLNNISLLQNQLQEAYNKKYGYSTSYEFTQEQLQINNKFYSGNAYEMSQNGDIITISDGTKDVEINLNDFTKDVKNSIYKTILKATLQRLPAEVLFDMKNEIKGISIGDEKDESIAGYYTSDGKEYIYVDKDEIQRYIESPDYGWLGELLTHETGHAIDNLYGNNHSYMTKNDTQYDRLFKNFEKSLQAIDNDDGTVTYLLQNKNEESKSTTNSITTNRPYAFTNSAEMFAELYATCMLARAHGDVLGTLVTENNDGQVLLNYMKNNLLENVRNKAASIRTNTSE